MSYLYKFSEDDKISQYYDGLYKQKFLRKQFIEKKKKFLKINIEAILVSLAIFTIVGFSFFLVVNKYVLGNENIISMEISSPKVASTVQPTVNSQYYEQNIQANIKKLEQEHKRLLELNMEVNKKTLAVEKKLNKASSDLYHITQTIVSMKGNQSIQVVTVPNYEANPKIKGAFTPPESPNNENWSKVQ